MNFKGNIGELENQALEISQNKTHRVEEIFKQGFRGSFGT